MKGRQRARQLALQALYEVDQTTHPVEDILRGRVDDLYRSGAKNGLSAGEWPVAEALLNVRAPDGLLAVDPVAEGERLGVAADRIRSVLVVIGGLQRQAAYGCAIARGVLANRAGIDGVIARIAPEWPVDQMAPVDRNVLRIALWEIGQGTVPPRVAINEAVELARRFSGEGARRMVNGALGTYTASDIALDLRPAGPEANGLEG